MSTKHTMRWDDRFAIEDAMNNMETDDSDLPAHAVAEEVVATDPASVRRELMALALRDVITDRDRVLLGAAIGLIGGVL